MRRPGIRPMRPTHADSHTHTAAATFVVTATAVIPRFAAVLLATPPPPCVRVGPCNGITTSAGIGPRSSALRMKLRRLTTSSAVWIGRPAARSAAACPASRQCSSVPSSRMSASAASTASRMRRERSELVMALSGGASAAGWARSRRSRRWVGSTVSCPVNEPPSVR